MNWYRYLAALSLIAHAACGGGGGSNNNNNNNNNPDPPEPVTMLAAVSDMGEITVSWINPMAFRQVLVLRLDGTTNDAELQDGRTYTINQTIGSGTVVFLGRAATFVEDLRGCGPVTYAVYAQNAASEWSAPETVEIQLMDPPAVPVVTGPAERCGDNLDNVPLSVSVDEGASILWPSGAGIMLVSGQGTANAVYSLSSAIVPQGIVAFVVEATTACGSTMSLPFRMRLSAVAPATPSISGTTDGCEGSASTYAASGAPEATGYVWTIPLGASIASGSGTATVDVVFGRLDGAVAVRAVNGCGSSALASVAVAISPLPSAPGAITGITTTCGGVMGLDYSIAPVAEADSYTWSIPSDATITAGDTTDTITVDLGVMSGDISVTADNTCGSSAPSTLTVDVSGSLPADPGTVTGDVSACSNGQVMYSVPVSAGATNYVWSLPAGASITAGDGTESITAILGTTAGNVTVTPENSCGVAATSAPLAVSIMGTGPTPPSAITGPSAACDAQAGLMFSVVNDPGATAGYTWTLPAGASITAGDTTNAVTVTWGTVGGDVVVQSANTCGMSAPSTLSVNQWGTAAPTAMTQPTSNVAGTSFTFSVGPVGADDYESELALGPFSSWTTLGTDTVPSVSQTINDIGAYSIRTRGNLAGCTSTDFATSNVFYAFGPFSTRHAAQHTLGMNAVTTGGGLSVAVGENATLLRSADGGVTWADATSAPAFTGLGVAAGTGAGDESYVGVGVGGAIVSSTDADTWVTRMSCTAEDLNGVGYDAVGESFVAVGNAGAVCVSVDGVTWTMGTSGVGIALYGVAPLGTSGGFIAVGASGTVMTSADGGATWAAPTNPGGANSFFGVAVSGTSYVAVGTGGTIFETSDSGTMWNDRSQATAEDLLGVFANGAAVSVVGTSGVSFVSANTGVAWSANGTATMRDLGGVVYDAAQTSWIAVGADAVSGDPVVVASADATTWGKTLHDTVVRGFADSGSEVVAVGDDGAILRSADDGGTFTLRPGGTGLDINGVTYGAAFVAVGEGGIAYQSADGLAWTTSSIDGTTDFTSVAYGGGRYAAVGQGGTVYWSLDGTTWMAATASATAAALSAVAHDGAGRFVAAGAGGVVTTSTDGDTWTAPTSMVAADLTGAAFGGGTFVVTGVDGTAATSSDGTTWVAQTAGGASDDHQSLTYIQGMFVAVGLGGSAALSADGATWEVGAPLTGDAVTVGAAGIQALVGYSGTEIVRTP